MSQQRDLGLWPRTHGLDHELSRSNIEKVSQEWEGRLRLNKREVWKWIRNFIPHFLMNAMTYPYWELIQSVLIKGGPEGSFAEIRDIMRLLVKMKRRLSPLFIYMTTAVADIYTYIYIYIYIYIYMCVCVCVCVCVQLWKLVFEKYLTDSSKHPGVSKCKGCPIVLSVYGIPL